MSDHEFEHTGDDVSEILDETLALPGEVTDDVAARIETLGGKLDGLATSLGNQDIRSISLETKLDHIIAKLEEVKDKAGDEADNALDEIESETNKVEDQIEEIPQTVSKRQHKMLMNKRKNK